MGIGSKLDKILKEKNISAIELARTINVAPSTIYSIIQRDNKKIDIQVLFDIAHALGVDAEYFAEKNEKNFVTHAHDMMLIHANPETKEEVQILFEIKGLSDSGKKRVSEYAKKLREIEEADFELNAAHTRTDIKVEEGADISENHIMDDDNF